MSGNRNGFVDRMGRMNLGERGGSQGRGGGGFHHQRGPTRGAPRGGGGGFNSGYSNRPLKTMPIGAPILPVTEAASKIGGKWIAPDAVDFKPPPSQGTGVLCQRKIKIESNHISTKIDFPSKIYHYELNVKYGDRLAKKGMGPKTQKPKDPSGEMAASDEVRPKLWKKVVQHVLPGIETRHRERGGSPVTIASDYSKALYTITELLGIDEQYSVNAKDMLDESDESTSCFVVVVQPTKAVISTSGLNELVNNMMGKELPNIAEIEQVYNIVLKTVPISLFVHVGRASFFNMARDDGFNLGGGLCNHAGFSLIYSLAWKPLINVDVANSAFILGAEVSRVLAELFQSEFRGSNPHDVSTWGQRELARTNELLRTCRVTYQSNRSGGPQMKRRVEGVINQCPRDIKFSEKEGDRKRNVEEYFLEKGFTLKYPKGPCLYVGNNKAAIPAELCIVEKGQSFNKKLSDYQTAAMIKDTAKPPAERRNRIMQSIQSLKFGNDPVLKEFGVTVRPENLGGPVLLRFNEARVLQTPELCYGPQGVQKAPIENGVWNIWDFDFKFINPAKVQKWRVLYMNSQILGKDEKKHRPDFTNFMEQFRKMCTRSGMILPDMECVDTLNVDRMEFENELTKYFSKLGYGEKSFIMIVIPQKNHRCYGIIKKVAELEDPSVLTQCVAYNNVSKNQTATLGNIVMKLNAKLGGVNHAVDLTRPLQMPNSQVDFVRYPILILGADVTHPSANSLMPSVAAVTGSFDRYGMQYCMYPQVQQRPEKNAAEVIEKLEEIVEKIIRNYKQQTGLVPRKIIFFRDGVGEGQYKEVLVTELGAIRRACRKIAGPKGKYFPQITFMTVQKVHKTRFFVTNVADGIGLSKNAPPGVVVDNVIISATESDFYLLSHQGIQGTSRPTRYHVLWDDSNFSPDEIQTLTYALCHSYSRCARTVSIPAPTYYAHLGAYRVRTQIEAMAPSAYDNVEKLNRLVQRTIKFQIDYPMHFI